MAPHWPQALQTNSGSSSDSRISSSHLSTCSAESFTLATPIVLAEDEQDADASLAHLAKIPAFIRRYNDGKEIRPDTALDRRFSDWLKENHPGLCGDMRYYHHNTAEWESEAVNTPIRCFRYTSNMLTASRYPPTRKSIFGRGIRRRCPIVPSYYRDPPGQALALRRRQEVSRLRRGASRVRLHD